MKKILLILALAALSGFDIVRAGDDLEHPVVKPIAGSQFLADNSSREDFGELRVDYAGELGEQRVAEGIEWKLAYQIDAMSRDEIKANYIRAVQAIGGEHYGLNRATRANFRIPTVDGGVSWLKLVLKSGGIYELEIIDEAQLELAVTFDAEGLTKRLLEKGRVSIHEILFATDRDRLLPGSGAALDVISQVLIAQPSLSVEIQGHTDATGTAARNRALSASRADTVKAALALYGIPAARMRTRGYGASMPIADNGTEEGRRLNRRVDFALPGYEQAEVPSFPHRRPST